MTPLCVQFYSSGLIFWMIQKSSFFMLPNTTDLLYPSSSSDTRNIYIHGVSKIRRKRYIFSREMSALLGYHNQVRAQVSPPAANMEYMYADASVARDRQPTTSNSQLSIQNVSVSKQSTSKSPVIQIWDERLARSAEAWAKRCLWEHGPPQLMTLIGQNLAIHSGRYYSVMDLVKSWYYEKQHYTFPYPHECKPRCPSKCNGSVCSHYTQMVWASSNRIGCAIHTCTNINVWGSTWRQAVYLVCNYAIKGNWIGEAPYKMGKPCSACPPSYGGTCSNNMCYLGFKSNRIGWF